MSGEWRGDFRGVAMVALIAKSTVDGLRQFGKHLAASCEAQLYGVYPMAYYAKLRGGGRKFRGSSSVGVPQLGPIAEHNSGGACSRSLLNS